MVKLRFHFSSDTLEFDNHIKVNEKEYILEDGASDIYIELSKKENCVKVAITSKPHLAPQKKANFLQKIVGTLMMMLITGWSTEDIYECDCNKCSTHLLLSFEDCFEANVTVNRKVLLQETTIECSTENCRIIEQHNECELDHNSIDMFFVSRNGLIVGERDFSWQYCYLY